MKNKFIIILLALLVGVFSLLLLKGQPEPHIPQGFAPIDVVYHGSTQPSIEVFEPRNIHVRDPSEGPVVFATPSLRLASCYLFTWDDAWVQQAVFSKQSGDVFQYTVVMIISNKARFDQEDQGGTLYLLPAKDFGFDAGRGMGIFEWTCKERVQPMYSMHFTSALAAMLKFGVEVYFVTQSQFDHYASLSFKEREAFLEGLDKEKPFAASSENALEL